MLHSQNLRPAKGLYFFGFILLLLISAVCMAFSMTESEDFGVARREILLRRLGHEILLQSGDSTSRVLPVQKISENEYQISFDNDFSFQTGTIISTTQRLLAKDPLADDYVVNVINCSDASVAYGYALSKDKKENIVSCIGRKQPKACYRINIKFRPFGITASKKGYILGSLSFLAVVGVVFIRYGKPRKTFSKNRHANEFTLGSVLFDAKEKKLFANENAIDLTGTETRVLLIFASSPNQIIERSRLQKEIWEDEGVVVGRSLDMFISKLRKKLELDPNIRIAVIRGKGYKLEINA